MKSGPLDGLTFAVKDIIGMRSAGFGVESAPWMPTESWSGWRKAFMRPERAVPGRLMNAGPGSVGAGSDMLALHRRTGGNFPTPL